MSPKNTQEPNGRSDPEEAVLALRKKAQAALSDAEVLLERGSPEATINRGYYAVFQAARAALLTEGESLSRPLWCYSTFRVPFRPDQTGVRRGWRHPYHRAVDRRRSRLRSIFGFRAGGGRRACRKGPPVHRGCRGAGSSRPVVGSGVEPRAGASANPSGLHQNLPPR